MKYSNTVEYSEAIANLVKRNLDIVSLAKKEERELSEDEEKEFDENKEELKELEDEKEELEKSLENPEDEKEEKNKNINVNNMEKKNFSLFEDIKRSLNTGEQIELNRAYTVASEGEDLVQTDVYNILEPLRANLVLDKLGAHYIDNAVGNIQLPIMSAGSCTWEDETDSASSGAGSFSHVDMSPKRLTAFVEISDRLLAQDSVSAEASIKKDLIASIAQKIESTVFGDAAGSTKKPAGLFYGATLAHADTYAHLADMEADLEEANYDGEMKYVLSPKAKSAFRTMVKGQNNSGFVLEGNEVDGTPFVKTSNVASKKFLYGDWSMLYVAIWQNITLDVCRDSASRKKGVITLVVNMQVDVKLARPTAIICGTVEAAE